MRKTILVTGSTDGIGLETAKMLAKADHHLLLHGRNPAKLEDAARTITDEAGGGSIDQENCDAILRVVEAIPAKRGV